VAPGAVLLLGATVILQSASLREAVTVSAPVYPWIVFGAGLLLGWRFNRSQLVVALAVLFAANRALAAFPADVSPTGRTVFACVALLLPLDLALLAWLTERSIVAWSGRLVLGVILAEPLAVALVLRPELVDLARALDHVFVAAALPWLPIPQPALLAFVAALGLIALRFWTRRTVIQSNFVWTVLAAFLALNSGTAAASTVYLTTGGLVLVVSLIETSHRMAFSDELTGLPSRRALTDALLRLPEVYAIAMIDIDHFKKLNDEHGHAVGDQVLRLIGTTLTRTEGGGRPFRYGGEEFAVLFPGKSAEEALPYLEDLREAIEASSFVVRGRDRPTRRPKPVRSSGGRKSLEVTVSIGVAEPEDLGADPEEVIRAADQALYRAKRAGRNRVCS
jgi:diguanylate cyclase (GGDEF)-like protein